MIALSSPNGIWRFRATRCVGWIAVLAALAVSSSTSLYANPIHYPDTIAHGDKRSWTDADGHHQHRSNHEVMNWGDGDGKYDANKVWSNENLNFVGDTTHGSHGFIEENSVDAPDFFFAGDWTVGDGPKAKPLVTEAFGVWSAIKSDRPDLTMGLLFNETDTELVAEIQVHWGTVADFPGLNDAVAYFDTNPIGAGAAAYYNLVFDSANSWYFGGDKAGFLASTKDDDFFTVALHETGHITGLQHQADKDDVMETMAGSNDSVMAGGVFRSLGNDDIDGARDLYSVPEPGMLLLLGTGLAAAARRVAKKRHA